MVNNLTNKFYYYYYYQSVNIAMLALESFDDVQKAFVMAKENLSEILSGMSYIREERKRRMVGGKQLVLIEREVMGEVKLYYLFRYYTCIHICAFL